MPSFKDEAGKKYGSLLVIRRAQSRQAHAQWLCKCDCGNETITSGRNLRLGLTKSCGCLMKENALLSAQKKVGWRKENANKRHQSYDRWRGIKKRCFNPKHDAYEYYGGRGITLYEQWIDDFQSFASYLDENLGKCPEGFTLDRIDNDKHYEPNNLRWSDRETQRGNQRPRQHKS